MGAQRGNLAEIATTIGLRGLVAVAAIDLGLRPLSEAARGQDVHDDIAEVRPGM